MFETLAFGQNNPVECSNRQPTCLSHPRNYFKLVKINKKIKAHANCMKANVASWYPVPA